MGTGHRSTEAFAGNPDCILMQKAPPRRSGEGLLSCFAVRWDWKVGLDEVAEHDERQDEQEHDDAGHANSRLPKLPS